MNPQAEATPEGEDLACCADALDSTSGSDTGVGAVQQKFQDFLRSASQPGALDAYTKQAIAIALSVMARCEPCLKMHMKKAKQKGFSQEEIDEAAWMAISFGGSPLMVWYEDVKKRR